MIKSKFLPSKRDLAIFRSAESIAKLSDHRCQIGCVVVNQHKIISSGCNTHSKTHKFQALLDKKQFDDDTCNGYLHAEINALLPLIKNNVNLSRAIIYTFRRDKNNDLCLSRPCSRCMSVIKSLGIKKLKYTTEYGYASEVLI